MYAKLRGVGFVTTLKEWESNQGWIIKIFCGDGLYDTFIAARTSHPGF